MATVAAGLSRLKSKTGVTSIIALTELGIVLVLIAAHIWVYRGNFITAFATTMAVIIGGWAWRKESLSDIGLVNPGWACVPMAIFLGKMAVGALPHTDKNWMKFTLFFIGYYAWATLQQLVLNGFFAKRLQESGMFGSAVPLVAGFIFGAIHFPNEILMLASFLGGMAASYVFLRMRRKNIYWLALVHAAVAVALFEGVPPAWHHHFTIGPAFWTSH